MKTTLSQIARASNAAGLDYLLIGGHAVILSGVPRMTADIDLMVKRDALEGWRNLLECLGYRCYHETASFAQFERTPEGIPVDLMLVAAETWNKLWPARGEGELGDERFHLPSPAHLVAIKLAAMSDPSREGAGRDWEDVVGLITAQSLDLSDPEFRALVLRYGGDEILADLERISTRT
jgi:hypothetical protein